MTAYTQRDALDETLAAVLGIDEAGQLRTASRRRRHGLLIALPLAIGIGMTTVGALHDDGPVSAVVGMQTPGSRSMAVARPVVPVTHPAVPERKAAPRTVVLGSVDGYGAPLQKLRHNAAPLQRPFASASASVGSLAGSAEAAKETDLHASSMQAPEPARPSIDFDDRAEEDRNVRLAAVDAIRSLRLR